MEKLVFLSVAGTSFEFDGIPLYFNQLSLLGELSRVRQCCRVVCVCVCVCVFVCDGSMTHYPFQQSTLTFPTIITLDLC